MTCSPTVLLSKTYHGFEDAVDLDRDVSEIFMGRDDIPGEFQGTITVTITYTPPDVEADPT
jgi:hypothetical protein